MAIGISALVLAAGIGVGLLINHSTPPTTFVEVYVTDLPADFSRLDVRVARVEVGPQRVPLELDNFAFDLLSLQGPGDALRVARGYAPAAKDQEIRIIFASAQVRLDHQNIPVDVPEAVLSLGHDYGLDQKKPKSILFDIDVNQSLVIDGPRISFEPYVAAVYMVEQGTVASRSSDVPDNRQPVNARVDFTAAQPQEPKRQALEEEPKFTESKNPFATVTRTVTSSTTTTVRPTKDTSPTTTPPSGGGGPGDGNGSDMFPSPGDSAAAEDYTRTLLGYFLQYAPEGANMSEIQHDIEVTGAEIIYRFESLPALYVMGSEVHMATIAKNAWVTYVEPAMNLTFHLASTKQAIRSGQVTNSVTGLKDAQGRIIDGRGVGLAVVDTGIDGLHPDLTHFLISGDNAAVRANFKVVSNNLVDMPNTDTSSGHGTHVAGIAAGRGTKDPSMKGVAPGAKLYGLGIGELASTFWPNQAFDWIIQHGHKQNPPIKVVTNSWGTKGAYNPDSLTTQLVNLMVAKGMVVVFSVGNDGTAPDGSDTTSAQCKIPTPGVICVSWYDDIDGTVNGQMDEGSSRGVASDASTWPDVAAPGTAVRSARTPFGWVTGVGLTDYYVTLKGSSMSAPHVAGAAALMLQAKPALTPAQVETLIKSSAYKFGGSDYTSNGHHVKGHGLLDTYEAVVAAKNA